MTTVANEALSVILARRSIASLGEPGPSPDQLDAILAAATTVPDHGSLTPWRFAVVTGDGREAFGDALLAIAAERDPELPDAVRSKLKNKAFLAPVLVVVIASPKPSEKVPEWEQVVSASCTGYAIALAAYSLGLGAVWKSANQLSGTAMTDLLDLDGSERLLGWVAIGTPAKEDRRRLDPPSAAGHVQVLDGTRLRPYQA